ncbi:hypothetical protein OC846_003660 [Tilletia horrida]|uniref:AMP-dependent synthetase/ligase domain-containing protein n=1 Tax=Tilletia horrida TaxID=155126 RepID=A0AAN6GPP5_9BASI|nr:hypothetical protein OC846_003660 [Tilletia horrida]
MIFHSPHPDLNVPPYRSLPNFLFEHPSFARAEHQSTLGQALRTPILYGSPSPKSSRQNVKPLSLLDLKERARAFAVSLLLPPAHAQQRQQPWQHGDVLLLFATSQHDYAAAVLGAQMAGGTVALANPSYKSHELAHQLRLVGGPKAVLTLVAHLNVVQEAILLAQDLDEPEAGLSRIEHAPNIWVFEEDDDEQQSWFKHLIQPGEALLKNDSKKAEAALEAVQIDPANDTAVLCFSSGTSGLPKAVRLSHTNIISNLIQATFLLHDRLNPPLFDDANWYRHATTNSAANTPAVKTPARKGSTVEQGIQKSFSSMLLSHLPNGDNSDDGSHPQQQHANMINKALRRLPFLKAKSQKVAKGSATPRIVLHRFEPEVFLQAVQEKHVTFAFVVPPILLMLAKSPIVDSYDIHSLRRVASGAASLSQELAAAVRKRTGIVVTDGYGMSEMSPIISLQTLADLDAAPGTVGTLAPSTIARVISPDGKDLGPNEEGELILSGPQVMQGYLKNDAANESAFWRDAEASEASGKRWLRTGDVVRINESGYITITDRLKDVIKANGFQVSPAELEGILFQDERVGDVAVLGVKDPKDGSEKPWAFIVRAAPKSPSAGAPPLPSKEEAKEEDDDDDEEEESRTEAVMEAFNKKVAGYKKLAGITWVEKLPKSDSGKILKRELRDLL